MHECCDPKRPIESQPARPERPHRIAYERHPLERETVEHLIEKFNGTAANVIGEGRCRVRKAVRRQVNRKQPESGKLGHQWSPHSAGRTDPADHQYVRSFATRQHVRLSSD
jgi:hypothetical protein